MQKLLQKFETFVYSYFIFLILFIPLYLKFPLLPLKGTFISVRFEDVLIALLYLFFGTYLIASKSLKKLRNDKIIYALVVFFIIGAISVFSGSYLTQTITPSIGILHYLRRIELMLLLPLTYHLINSKKRFYQATSTLFVVVIIAILYALGQKFLSFPVVSTTNSALSKGVIYYLGETDRVGSTFAGHYDLAIFLMMALSPIFSVILYKLKEKDYKIKNLISNYSFELMLIITFTLALFVLILTAARLSFVAAIFAILFLLFAIKRKRLIIVFLAFVALIFAYPSQLRDRYVSTITVNIARSWQSFESTSQVQNEQSKLNIPTLPRINDQQETQNQSGAADIVPGEPTNITDLGVFRSFDIRLKVEWPRALRAFYKNPLLGLGYSSLGLATDNDVLRSLGETGLFGFLAFVAIIYIVARKLFKRFKKSKGLQKFIVAGFMASFYAFLLNSLVIDVFEASKAASLFWIMVGTAISRTKA